MISNRLSKICAIIVACMVVCFGAATLSSLSTPVAISTFESIGLTAKFVGDGDYDSKCGIQYRIKGTATWKTGHSLFTSKKKKDYRGSLVHLKPGTSYEIKLNATDPDGGKFSKTIVAKTWSEKFPEGEKTVINNQSTMINITKSGTPNAYRVYEGPKDGIGVIDGKKLIKVGININASYIIIRNLKLVNIKNRCINIVPGSNDIVIDGVEMTNFGPPTGPGTFDSPECSGVFCASSQNKTKRVVIQNCQIHNPTARSNSWAENIPGKTSKHPKGGVAISFYRTGGNHVIRYNRLYSRKDGYYKDVIATEGGASWSNTDIYGNQVSNCYDDLLEMESDDENLRIWGNHISQGYQGIACRQGDWPQDPIVGPVYVWRNIFTDLWKYGTQKGNVMKVRGTAPFYVYNNSFIRTGSKNSCARRTWTGEWIENVTCKNNIIDTDEPVNTYLQKNWHTKAPVYNNFLNHNMYRKAESQLPLAGSWEGKGVFSVPLSYNRVGAYGYVLKPGGKGIDGGTVIPGFAEAFSGSAPDIGACELGVFEMRIGPKGQATPEITASQSIVRHGQGAENIAVSQTGGVTRISVSNPAGESAFLSLFDIRGRLVETLSSGTSITGRQVVFLNSNRFASGHYYLRLRTSQAGTCKKLTIAN